MGLGLGLGLGFRLRLGLRLRLGFGLGLGFEKKKTAVAAGGLGRQVAQLVHAKHGSAVHLSKIPACARAVRLIGDRPS